MTQTFEIFKGDPAGLKARLDSIRDNDSGTIIQVMLCTAAANYLIIWQS